MAAGFIPSVSGLFWQNVIHDWPIMFAISYVFAFFVTKVALRIAMAAVGSDLKSEHSPQNQM